MMSDSGKHRAVASKQNSDGTFEFVMETVDDGAIFREESEVSEVFVEAAPAQSPRSPVRVIVPVVAVILLIGLGGIGYWVFSSSGASGGEDELRVVPGFKPYTGGAAGVRARKSRPQPKLRVPTPPKPVVREEPVENDPGPAPEEESEPTVAPDRDEPLRSAQIRAMPVIKPSKMEFKEARNLADRLKRANRIDTSRLPMNEIQRVPRDTNGAEIGEQDSSHVDPPDEPTDDPPDDEVEE